MCLAPTAHALTIFNCFVCSLQYVLTQIFPRKKFQCWAESSPPEWVYLCFLGIGTLWMWNVNGDFWRCYVFFFFYYFFSTAVTFNTCIWAMRTMDVIYYKMCIMLLVWIPTRMSTFWSRFWTACKIKKLHYTFDLFIVTQLIIFLCSRVQAWLCTSAKTFSRNQQMLSRRRFSWIKLDLTPGVA